jgi:RNA 2',3'-cyclic 3'-phosphodiesterase
VGIRSFLAFELPSQIREVLIDLFGKAKKTSLDVRWVRPEGIHLTVIFMGDVREEDIPAMAEFIGTVCSGYGPFTVALQGMGCFPNSRNPRVLWLGVEGSLERMSRFQNELQRGLAPFGIREEKRDFRPHLTLGRFKRPLKTAGGLEKLLAEHRGLTSPVCSLNELILFRSDLRPGGAVYTKMRSWLLAGNQ